MATEHALSQLDLQVLQAAKHVLTADTSACLFILEAQTIAKRRRVMVTLYFILPHCLCRILHMSALVATPLAETNHSKLWQDVACALGCECKDLQDKHRL